MALTKGTGPFAPNPEGTFNFDAVARGGDDIPRRDGSDAPAHTLFFEPSPRRVRVTFNGRTIADSARMKLLHETAILPVYYFPIEDVNSDYLEDSELTTVCPFKGTASYYSVVVDDRRADDAAWYYPDPKDGAPALDGYVAFTWEAMDHWYEEDEEIFVHPRDPYHRVDALDSSRQVRVEVDGETVAESDRPVVLFESGLPPRYYLPREDVRDELLVDSELTTECPYKGTASYYSVKVGGTATGGDDDAGDNLVWYYPDPNPAVAKIQDRLAFYNEKVALYVDGELRERPGSPFS